MLLIKKTKLIIQKQNFPLLAILHLKQTSKLQVQHPI